MHFQAQLPRACSWRAPPAIDSELECDKTQGQQQTQYLMSWEEVTMLQADVPATERAGGELAL